MNAQNEKPIEYEPIPLWQHPLSIVLMLAVLIAGGSWYISREQTETNKMNILKKVTAPVNTKQAQNQKQMINNTQIKQVNPNDIAVVRVHDTDNGIDSKVSQSSLSTLNVESRRIAQEVEELESRLIADKVEELESALQKQQDIQVKSSTTKNTKPTSIKTNALKVKDKQTKKIQTKVSVSKANNKESITQSTPATKKKSTTKTRDKTATTGGTIAKSTTHSATRPTIKTATKQIPKDNLPIASPTNPQPITKNEVSISTPPSSEINLTKEQISQLAQELIEVEKDMEIDSTTH